MRRLATAAFLLAASPAFAQQTEVALLAGYGTSGNIDKKAAGIQEVEIDGGFDWGVTAGHFFSDHLGLEASWAQQRGPLVIGTRAGSADLFAVNIGRLQGSFVYQFGNGNARLRPFLLAGLGAAFLSAEDLDGETKLSWAAGAGLKWYPSRNVGARLQARYTPILLNDSSSTVCDPFGFCQGSLHQFELLGGMVIRF